MPKQIRYFMYAVILIAILVIRFILLGDKSAPTGPYCGQALPDSAPTIFAPGFISDQFRERDAAFTPDGTEFYFSLWSGSFAVILFSRQVNGRWSEPDIVPFANGYSDVEPFITHDGARLYFSSNRPIAGETPKDYDIWFVERRQQVWGEAQRLDSTINSPSDEFYPTLTRTGSLYFTAQRSDSYGGEDIYRSVFRDGNFQTPENLGPGVNSARGEFNALIAPDESYLIFSSFGRPDGLGGGDLYISFKSENTWQPAMNMGKRINSDRLDYCPALTPDGEFFMFTSTRMTVRNNPHLKLSELKQQLTSTGNGYEDIYWLKSEFIDSLRSNQF